MKEESVTISVLIIENCIYSADLNVRELRKAGFLVNYLTVNNARTMLQALRSKDWDLILSDNSMGNFNALQALGIRNIINQSIPFIIVTEDITTQELDNAFRNGCNGYVAKAGLSELRKSAGEILSSI